jgi:hypothetical protein
MYIHSTKCLKALKKDLLLQAKRQEQRLLKKAENPKENITAVNCCFRYLFSYFFVNNTKQTFSCKVFIFRAYKELSVTIFQLYLTNSN